MAKEAAFNSDNIFYRLSENDTDKTVLQAHDPSLTFISLSDDDFSAVQKGRKFITGKTGSTINFESLETVTIKKTQAEETLNTYISIIDDYVAGNTNTMATTLTSQKTTLQGIDLDTIITWTDGASTDYCSLEDILLNNGHSIKTLIQIP